MSQEYDGPLTSAQLGALAELSRKLDDKGEGRAPKWRARKTVNALVDGGYIERVEPAFPQRYRITALGWNIITRQTIGA